MTDHLDGLTNIIAYLGTKVNVQAEREHYEKDTKRIELLGVDFHPIDHNISFRQYYTANVGQSSQHDTCHHSDIKLILRPISDMDKEIEFDGKKLTPVDVLSEILSNTNGCNFNTTESRKWILQLPVLELPYFIVQKLIKWHFDVFGLIEKNEAVDVNTI